MTWDASMTGVVVRWDVDSIARESLGRVAAELGLLDHAQQLEALIPCMRQSAQDTLAALHRRGFRIVAQPKERS